MMPFFAAVLPIVILFCGLSIDVGMLQLRKLQLQTAADSGALGAELEMERNTGNWVAAGKLDSGINGYVDGANNVTVAVSLSASENAYAGDYSVIQVTITQQVKTLFLGALNGGTAAVSATGVALIPPCSYFTGATRTRQYPFYVASAGVYLPCPLYANQAIGVDGFARLTAANGIVVAGPASNSYLPGRTSPTPRFNALTMADPLAWENSPSFSACTHTKYALTSGSDTLSPGTYCGGTDSSGNTIPGITVTNATLTLQPGLYIITGGAVWSKNATVTGTGVTLFFTKGGGAGFGIFNIDHSTVHLSAPSDASQGGLPAILVFGDRSWISASPGSEDFQIVFSTFQGDGVWYLTGTGLYDWASSFGGINYCGIVADNMYVFGATMRPLNNYSNIPTGNPFRPLGGLVQ